MSTQPGRVDRQEAGFTSGGPVGNVGTYSSSWILSSNVRLATISRATIGIIVIDPLATDDPETVHQARL
jgi:hypothetical protein